MEIRTFRPDDRKLVEAFFDQMSGETRTLFDRGSFNRNNALGYFEGKDKDVIRWLCLNEGRMVGYVFLWDLKTGVPWLGIAVSEDYMGKGLGRRLLKTAHDYAHEKEKGAVMLTTHVANLRAQALYERCGYERLGMHTSGEILYMYRFSKVQP